MIKTTFPTTFVDIEALLTGAHGQQPTFEHVSFSVFVISIICSLGISFARIQTRKSVFSMFRGMGIEATKIARTLKEIERKTFHLTGLGVPLLYYVTIHHLGWTRADYISFCWYSTAIIWISDGFRVLNPWVLDYPPYMLLKNIIREKEKSQLSGTCYFSLGSALSITLFPVPVAITSIVWLVVGDMSAAVIGVAYGGEKCSLKLGREGKKSLEGSVAMFFSCIVIGLALFAGVRLSDYAVFIGALVATLVELFEPFGLNDNVTIPLFSGLFLNWALARVEHC